MRYFLKSWRGSRKPRKQRKYRMNAPLHIKHRLVHSHLSKDLRRKYRRRNTGLRKGDKVKILRGQFKKHEGKVERIDLKNTKIFVSGAELTKRDGTKRSLALHPSNLMIIELNLDDKFRQKLLERK